MAMLNVLNNSPTGDLGEIAGIIKGCVREVSTGNSYTDACLCCSAHTSGCVVDGLGTRTAH